MPKNVNILKNSGMDKRRTTREIRNKSNLAFYNRAFMINKCREVKILSAIFITLKTTDLRRDILS